MNDKWFALSISQLEKKLKTNAASGLSRKAARSAWYRTSQGAEALFVRKNKRVGKMLGEVVADFALIILMLAAIFAVLFDERTMGFTVLAICFINISVAFFAYFRSQRTMEKMDVYFSPTAKVIRGGKLYRTSFENIVAGDVIIVQKGDVVCGDARLIVSDKLTVLMRVDRKKSVRLKKQAHGVVNPDEINPAKMTNIIHAGSVIEEGSGRAIVYATGKYTYLGAMTGGIQELYCDNTPRELKKMKKICSQTSFISMLCILPFSILSLLFSHLNGGNATLSSAFLTALALCASSMTQIACTLCKLFFIKKISDIAKAANPAIIRTTDAFERLSDVDCVFLLDGSSLTDGMLHFETAFTLEGDVKSYENYNATVASLFQMAALYNSAESNSLSVGLNLPERYKLGMNEFVGIGKTDVEALKIRYPIKSYLQGTPTDPVDKVNYCEAGRGMTLCVASTDTIFSQCSYALVSGKVQPLTNVGIDRLRHTYNMHIVQGKTVLVFTVSSFENSGRTDGKLFIGAVVLREGVDKNAFADIINLRKRGIKVISFVGGSKPEMTPEIPVEIQQGIKAYREDFVKNQLPVSYKFGEIDTYYGLEEADIEQLIDLAHKERHSVAVIGFSNFAKETIAKSDVFISCSPIINVFSAKNEEELYSLELAGAASSTSCIQTVKAASDVIIQRPDGKTGGIGSLKSAFAAAEVAYRNLYTFFRYMLCVQFIRIILVALPMAYGKPILDARHVLLCSFIMDIAVMLMLALDNKAVGKQKSDCEAYRIKPLKAHIKDNKTLFVAALVAGFAAIFLPLIIDMADIFGAYLYQIEYLMCTLLWLHLIVMFYTRYGSVKKIRQVVKNKWMVGIIIGSYIFVLIISTINPVGFLFDYVFNPISYFVLSFIPSVIFGAVYELYPMLEKRLKAK